MATESLAQQLVALLARGKSHVEAECLVAAQQLNCDSVTDCARSQEVGINLQIVHHRPCERQQNITFLQPSRSSRTIRRDAAYTYTSSRVGKIRQGAETRATRARAFRCNGK